MKSKGNLFKRVVSATIACSMVIMGSIVSNSINPTVYAASTNLIKNSTFDSGISGWNTYSASGGSATIAKEDGKLALKVNSVGSLNYSVQVY